MGVNAFHWAGTLWATVGGVCIGLLVVANKFVVPRFNLVSPVCLLDDCLDGSESTSHKKPACNGQTKVPTPSTTKSLDGFVKPTNLLPSLKKVNTPNIQTKDSLSPFLHPTIKDASSHLEGPRLAALSKTTTWMSSIPLSLM